ncbi:MAG: hypothetical protein K8S54_10395 [Spirochaetia bacterium]|nr:hypothetical protein [Spirochaetia bacterium]
MTAKRPGISSCPALTRTQDMAAHRNGTRNVSMPHDANWIRMRHWIEFTNSLRLLPPERANLSFESIGPESLSLPDLELLLARPRLESLRFRKITLGKSEVGVLARLTKLRRLHLDSCAVTNWKWLSKLTNLTTLSIVSCGMRTTDSLAGLGGLRDLNLSQNRLKRIKCDGLSNLVSLNLADNVIRGFQCLERLENLRYLNLVGNRPIKSLQILEKLPKLREVRANVSRREAIRFRTACPHVAIPGYDSFPALSSKRRR